MSRVPGPEARGIFCNIHTLTRFFQRPARGGLAWPFGLTAALLAARIMAAPQFGDPVGTPLSAGLHLAYPWPYVLLAPLFSLWDGVSMLSMSRLYGFLAGGAMLYVAWRLWRVLWRRLAYSPACWDSAAPRRPM